MTRRTDSIDVFGATLTRRQFVKSSGILAVGISVAGPVMLRGDIPKATVAKRRVAAKARSPACWRASTPFRSKPPVPAAHATRLAFTATKSARCA